MRPVRSAAIKVGVARNGSMSRGDRIARLSRSVCVIYPTATKTHVSVTYESSQSLQQRCGGSFKPRRQVYDGFRRGIPAFPNHHRFYSVLVNFFGIRIDRKYEVQARLDDQKQARTPRSGQVDLVDYVLDLKKCITQRCRNCYKSPDWQVILRHCPEDARNNNLRGVERAMVAAACAVGLWRGDQRSGLNPKLNCATIRENDFLDL